MKTAIIADIHANLHALDAVLADAARRGVTQFLCLGDVVGYGPHPEACVEKLRTLGIPTVLGNHDKWATAKSDFGALKMPPSTIPGMELAREQLTMASILWLLTSPLLIDQGLGNSGYAATHASFHALGAWESINDTQSAARSFRCMPCFVGFYGHTHAPAIWRFWPEAGKYKAIQWSERMPNIGRPYRLKTGEHYLINPGSVGNPITSAANPDNRAQYLIYEHLENHSKYDPGGLVTFHRVAYDIKACLDAMRKAGLPDEMIKKIELGY